MCEKPLAENTADAASMHAAAEEAGVFLQDAMWCDKHLAPWVTLHPTLKFPSTWSAAGRVSFRRLSTPGYSSKMVQSAT